MDQLPDIYTYDNYRLYLKDYFEYQRVHSYGASQRQFAKRAGFSSHSFLTHILRGDRNLSPASVEKMIQGVKLGGRQAAYFRSLVLYNQSKTPAQKEQYLKELQILRGDSLFVKVQPGQYDYYKHWYLPILRELAVLDQWKGNYAKLASLIRPKITEKEAKEGVTLLTRIGLLQKIPNGRFKLRNEVVTSEGIPGVVIRAARTEYMLRGIEASENMPKEDRHLSYAVLGTSEKHFRDIMEKMDTLRRELVQGVTEEDEVEKVICLQFQAFPVSEDLLKDTQ